jgi:general secretion pathway protein A
MRRSTNHRKNSSAVALDPFRPEPDKRFYYAFEAFEQRLAILRRLIQGSDALILVVGEEGSGKSTLLQRILVTTDKPWKPCRVQTAGSAAVGKLSRRKQAGHPSAFLLQNPDGTIVLMDDAHRLSRRELRKLLRDTLTSDPARKIKRMVLFGQPRLSSNFDAVSGDVIDETALNKIFLPTITEEEAAAFIRHRLAVAGFTGKNPFTPSVMKNLYHKSAGLPGRVNEAAARWWSKKKFSGNSSQEKFRHKRSRFLGVAGWCAAAVTAVIVAGVLWMSAERAFGPDSPLPANRRVVRVKIHGGGSQLQPRSEIAEASPGAEQRSFQRKPSPPAVSGKTQGRIAPESGLSKPSSAPPPASKQPVRIHREEWLLAQNPANYTLQLLGVRNERSLLAFVSDHGLERSGQVAYYSSRFKGGKWFPLVYGTYSTAGEARRAIAGLPEKIRSMSPWIRKLSAIQAEIRKAAAP